MRKKVFEVEVTMTVVVVAEDRNQASSLALSKVSDETQGASVIVNRLRSVGDIPHGWKFAIPYGTDGTKTVTKEITDRKAAA